MVPCRAIVIGGGPAGLMAAEQLANRGIEVAVYEAMPSVGRKFLRAGIGGLNLTHSEGAEAFRSRFAEQAPRVSQWLAHFDAEALRAWSAELGVETFVGSSGRVFPLQKKAAPLLRAWLRRLRSCGVEIHTRQRWLGWADDGQHRFAGPQGEHCVTAEVCVFALGGASWSALGSDGQWATAFADRGVICQPFAPSNCGFNSDWTAEFAEQWAGAALKNIAISLPGQPWYRKGDALISQYGIEGSLVYAASALLREEVARQGQVTLYWDLLPDKSEAALAEALARSKKGESLANRLRKLGLKGSKLALFKQLTSREQMQAISALPALIKRLPQRLRSPRPLDEAISTAGGVAFSELNEQLMMRALPGHFCSGEMLDWEAPTGGYLLTASFASGVVAGRAAADFLRR